MNQKNFKEKNDSSWLNKNILGAGLTSFFSDMSHEMTTAVLPVFLVNLVGGALAPQLLGIISGLSDASSSFVKTFSGWISDKIKKRKGLMMIGYAATGLFAGLTGFAASWWGVLMYRTFAWMGRGLREPPRDALIADSVSPKYYGRAFGFHRAMDTLGAIAGPLFVFFALARVGIHSIFIYSFIPGILAVFVVVLFTKEIPQKDNRTQSMGFWKDIAALPKEFRLFLLIMFLFGIGNFNRTLLLLRMQEVLTPTAGLIMAGSLTILLYTLRNAVQAVADYIVGHLSDIFGRKVLLAFFGFFIFGVLSLGLAYPIPTLWFFVIIFILSGISAASYMALEKAYAADLLPSNLRGTGYGVLQTIDGIGDFISSFMVGFLWSVLSPSTGFLYAAVLSFGSAILLYVLRNKKAF
jgi:MFS family permease